jgi:hypothetical protein
MDNHQSIAEAVVAEVQAIHAPTDTAEVTEAAEAAPEATEAPGEATAPEEDGGEVEVESEGSTETLSWNDAMRRVPSDIRQLMKQMQGDYTRKSQALAEQRKEFKREREALIKGSRKIKQPESLPEYDPFNESSVNARIEAEVAKRLQEVLQPMEMEYQTMQAEDSYRTFVSEHPDFKTDQGLRDEVQGMLEANANLDLETAYWAAQGRRGRVKKQQESQSRSARRRARKEAALKGTSPGRRPGTVQKPNKSDLKKMSAAEIYRLAESMHRNS